MATKKLLTASDLLAGLPDDILCLLQPFLVAIYDEKPNQIGTGFLTLWNARATLITAKHVLFGHQFNEEPFDKNVFVGGQLLPLSEIALSNVVENTEFDIAMLHLDRFLISDCLPYTALMPEGPPPSMVTIARFLSRDFRRAASESKLAPSPYSYTNKTVEADVNHVAVLYTNRGISTKSLERELTPIPRGLSGTAMVSVPSLLLGEVKVIGVFTDERLSESHVFGTHIAVVTRLLNDLRLI